MTKIIVLVAIALLFGGTAMAQERPCAEEGTCKDYDGFWSKLFCKWGWIDPPMVEVPCPPPPDAIEWTEIPFSPDKPWELGTEGGVRDEDWSLEWLESEPPGLIATLHTTWIPRTHPAADPNDTKGRIQIHIHKSPFVGVRESGDLFISDAVYDALLSYPMKLKWLTVRSNRIGMTVENGGNGQWRTQVELVRPGKPGESDTLFLSQYLQEWTDPVKRLWTTYRAERLPLKRGWNSYSQILTPESLEVTLNDGSYTVTREDVPEFFDAWRGEKFHFWWPVKIYTDSSVVNWCVSNGTPLTLQWRGIRTWGGTYQATEEE